VDAPLLFGKSPDDFGYDISVLEEDVDEFEEYSCRKVEHEG
jgi:hypothetical protein